MAFIGSGVLTAVACPSPTRCVAGFSNGSVDSSQYPTGGALAWRETLPAVAHPASIAAIACPSTARFLAVDTQGNLVWSQDPFANTLGQRAAWSGNRIDPTAALTGIACPSTRLCVAVDRAGHVLTSTNPTGDPGVWTLGHAPGLAARETLTAVSCSGANFCAAVAGGTDGALLATTHPALGASSWQPIALPAAWHVSLLDGIRCFAGGCVAVSQAGEILSASDPVVPSSWHRVAAALPLAAVACSPSRGFCAAVDGDRVFTTHHPMAQAPDWQEHHAGNPYLRLVTVSCPTRSFCLAGDQGGYEAFYQG